jgi:hypothetical protein
MKTFRVSTSSFADDWPPHYPSITVEIEAKSYRDAFEKSIPLFISNDNFHYSYNDEIILVVYGTTNFFQIYKKDKNNVTTFFPDYPIKYNYIVKQEIVHTCSGKFKPIGAKKSRAFHYQVMKRTSRLGKESFTIIKKIENYRPLEDFIESISKSAFDKFVNPNDVCFDHMIYYDDMEKKDDFFAYFDKVVPLGRWTMVPFPFRDEGIEDWKVYILFENVTDAIMAKLSV